VQVNAYMFGSVPLRTYLPDGDIDLSVFCSQDVAQSMRDTWALKLQSVIEQEQRSNSSAPYKIGDVTVINAEVREIYNVYAVGVRGLRNHCAGPIGCAGKPSSRNALIAT
jgi:hypothetical protein